MDAPDLFDIVSCIAWEMKEEKIMCSKVQISTILKYTHNYGDRCHSVVSAYPHAKKALMNVLKFTKRQKNKRQKLATCEWDLCAKVVPNEFLLTSYFYTKTSYRLSCNF